ncbi:MAG: hypothetical protein DHS20C17_22120 [Cyclobacteriaceae bacterium]|nr:MAG: hypothetical protein DHS20C17_22120 [Cyclobacteriaceae bacterium]
MGYMFKILVVCLLFILPAAFQSGLQFKEEDGRVSLYQDDQLVFSYQTETVSKDGQYPRANYVHPLNDFSGKPITEDFPEDHLHHRGIFWTWHQLYLDGQSLSDPWICEGISWDVHDLQYRVQGKKAALNASVDWLVGADKQALIKEKVQMEYQNHSDYYQLDFRITLQSQRDHVELGGSDDNKGYGGFSARLALGEDVAFSDATGIVTADNEQVEAGNWLLVEDIGENQTQVAILYHPESTADLQGWILRERNSMQNPVWPGRERAVLNEGEEVSIIASLVVFSDEVNKNQLEKIYKGFLGKKWLSVVN